MDDLLLLEPREDFDRYIVGISVFEGKIALVYDKDKLIDHWTSEFTESHIGDEPITEDEARTMAVEWFEYNVIGAYMGDHTPIYVSPNEYEYFEQHDYLEDEELTLLEPRDELDKFILGIGSRFGGLLGLAYDKDALIEYWMSQYKSEIKQLSDNDASILAVDKLERLVIDVPHTPILISKGELDLFMSKYAITPEVNNG